ncbi:MAG: hypothetical protein A2580_18010 [Hydrogenophilales bacterium RIFOXYD1_FULL_62_11]|nr:MAG: hypothetical protein A2580_18010 [Hydrogenophilales bacterium RIFOXYD1_FULL_62_11]
MTSPTNPTRSNPDAPATPASGLPPRSHQDVTIRDTYELMCEVSGHFIKRDLDERRWKIVKRLAISFIVLLGLVMWVSLYAPMLGWTAEPTGKALGVVPIQGQIGGRGTANAEQVVPAIERACKSRATQAVVLRISSPGGSPTDAERIVGALEACRPSGPDAKAKPVIAVIEGVGASAGYLIAVHADETIASPFALVGSIGAVMRSVDAEEAAEKFGVRERVFASGPLKAGNSPLSSNTPAQDAMAQSLVDRMAELFIAQVKERRGDKLKPDPEMFTGRVWLGQDALGLGLIDGLSTFEALKQDRFEDLPVHEFRPTETLQERLGLSSLVHELGAGIASGLTRTEVQ